MLLSFFISKSCFLHILQQEIGHSLSKFQSNLEPLELFGFILSVKFYGFGGARISFVLFL